MTLIVSGLERSGTSLMMQILQDAGYDVYYDNKRKPDIHNPKGYYELENGKIILSLMDDTFDLKNYTGKVIKITTYGLPMIRGNKHTVIYMKRDLKEILESQHKMMGVNWKHIIPENDEIELLDKLNKRAINHMNENNIDHIIIDYNQLMKVPRSELSTLSKFLGKDIMKSIGVIDKNLYRNRRN